VQVNNGAASNQQLGTLEFSHSQDLIGQCHRGGRSSHHTTMGMQHEGAS